MTNMLLKQTLLMIGPSTSRYRPPQFDSKPPTCHNNERLCICPTWPSIDMCKFFDMSFVFKRESGGIERQGNAAPNHSAMASRNMQQMAEREQG